MAVRSSNRYPSPMSTRPNPNPNPNPMNIPERENAIRKSFNGNPFPKPSGSPNSYGRSLNYTAPANSPADHARRSSFGKESITSSWDYEHKENERDPNSRLVKAKSPSVSKVTKNFMSSTISAASKTNASPRKKVLAERNESIRTSASLSDGKFHFYSVDSLDAPEEIAVPVSTENSPETSSIEAFSCLTATDFDKAGTKANKSSMTESKKDPGSVDPASRVTNIEKDDTADLPFEVIKLQEEPDVVVLSPEVALNSKVESSISPDTPKSITDAVSPSILAPLIADPSNLPYDPETNYLSPRPQFLHYKPNPRIEVYLNKGKRLEDKFSSEASSETRSTVETRSEDSLQENEDASSVDMASKELKPESSEPHAITPYLLNETVESKTVSKRHFSSRSKVIALFSVFLVAFLTILAPHSPVIHNAVLHHQTISRIYHDSHIVAEFAKEDLSILFQNARQLSAQFVNYLPRMIHGPREADKVIILEFSNSTVLDDSGFHVAEHIELGPFHKGESKVGLVKEVDKPQTLADTNIEQVPELKSHIEVEELAPSAEDGEVIKVDHFKAGLCEENSGLFPNTYGQSEYDSEPMDASDILVEESETHLALQTAPFELEHLEAVGITGGENDIVSDIRDELHNNIEAEDQLALPSQGQEDDGDLSYCNQFESGQTGEQQESLTQKASVGNYQFVKGLGLGDKFLAPSSLGIWLLLVTIVAAAVFTYVTQKKSSMKNAASSVINEFTAEKCVSKPIPEASTMEPSFHISPHSCSGPIEVDMIGDSCPSEMSSFRKGSSYYSKKGGGPMGVNEAQSQERKPRKNYKRESLASSDYTTTSYGSFTTYSTIHTKHGDDEVVTPVRRSSRIKNKVTSP